MTRRRRGEEVIPSARRLIKSLRDFGYDFAAAVADLVDNSIEARATEVRIDVEFAGEESWIRIADNGRGMTLPQLKEAMRYGAERDYDDDDLGKFGLGLKTASMSQCQRLLVASRSNPARADINGYCWDLDHIEETNRWEILPINQTGLAPIIKKPLKQTTGTVVVWQRLDRILGYKHPYGENARKRLSSMCRELEAHLSMVFHRFLAGEVRGRKLRIWINENHVEPWDPYCRREEETKRLEPTSFEIEQDGARGEAKVEPFVLPTQSSFSSPAAFNRASGPAKWNRQQGFYIYRADRMIQSGGWSKLRTIDEHTKLARVALSFPPKLDEAFKVNVAKMQVQLPTQYRENFEEAVAPVIKTARATYAKKAPSPRSASGAVSTSTPNAASPIVSPKISSTPHQPRNHLHLLNFADFAALIRAVAANAEKRLVEDLLERVRAQFEEKKP